MTRGKMILAALACALIPLAVLGAGKPDIGLNRGTEVGLSSALGSRGGKAKVDTFRVWSHETRMPNTAAKSAGYIFSDTTRYTTINTQYSTTNSTQYIKYGYVSKDTPTTVNYSAAWDGYSIFAGGSGNSLENDFTWQSNQRICFIWVSANGLKNGQRIESAYLMANADAFGQTIPANSRLYARLDTVSTDYRITATSAAAQGNGNDYARLNCTWNSPNAAIGAAWSPTLDARDDWHDFGPRSSTSIAPGTYAKGTCFRFNVTDAVQQAADNGTLSRGLLFVVYLSNSTNAPGLSAGMNVTFVGSAYGKGNPTFVATATSRRGAVPWGGSRMPVAFLFDNNYPVQATYYRALSDSGYNTTLCTSRYSWNSPQSRTWPDSIDILHPNTIRWVMQGYSSNRESVGYLSGTAVNKEFTRTWLNGFLTNDTDTTVINDFAWPGGAHYPIMDPEAVEIAIDQGFRSARNAMGEWVTQNTAFQHDNYLSWDGWVNKYMVHAIPAQNIFGYTGGDAGNQLARATHAQMKDEFEDYVDLLYTQYGRSAMVIYAHYDNPGSTPSWVCEDSLRVLIGNINSYKSVKIMDYRDIVSMRVNGATAKTPAQIVAARGITRDSSMIKAMAADQDSIYQLGGHNNLLQMWIAPK